MTNALHRLPVEAVEPDYASLSDHPYANLMPMMSEEERARQLAADIKRNGLQVRIDLFEGMILDGRNRYRALKSLGIAKPARPGPASTAQRSGTGKLWNGEKGR
jgi:hypothetical protein